MLVCPFDSSNNTFTCIWCWAPKRDGFKSEAQPFLGPQGWHQRGTNQGSGPSTRELIGVPKWNTFLTLWTDQHLAFRVNNHQHHFCVNYSNSPELFCHASGDHLPEMQHHFQALGEQAWVVNLFAQKTTKYTSIHWCYTIIQNMDI